MESRLLRHYFLFKVLYLGFRQITLMRLGFSSLTNEGRQCTVEKTTQSYEKGVRACFLYARHVTNLECNVFFMAQIRLGFILKAVSCVALLFFSNLICFIVPPKNMTNRIPTNRSPIYRLPYNPLSS